MRLSFSNRELAHVWASGSQAEGKGSSFFFEGDTIYSYGRHFPIARHISLPDGRRAVLFTYRGWGVTTSKHISYVRQAVNHLRRVSCYDPSYSLDYNISHERENIERILENIAATKHSGRIKKLSGDAGAIVQRVRALVQLRAEMYEENFTDEMPDWAVLPDNIKAAADALAAEKLQKAEQEKEAREILQKELVAAAKSELKKWSAGLPCKESGFELLPVALRISGTDIETSHGARVPLEDVRASDVWQAVKNVRESKKALEHTAMRLGHYTVNRIEADGTLVAGCHRIEFAELARIAPDVHGAGA